MITIIPHHKANTLINSTTKFKIFFKKRGIDSTKSLIIQFTHHSIISINCLDQRPMTNQISASQLNKQAVRLFKELSINRFRIQFIKWLLYHYTRDDCRYFASLRSQHLYSVMKVKCIRYSFSEMIRKPVRLLPIICHQYTMFLYMRWILFKITRIKRRNDIEY